MSHALDDYWERSKRDRILPVFHLATLRDRVRSDFEPSDNLIIMFAVET